MASMSPTAGSTKSRGSGRTAESSSSSAATSRSVCAICRLYRHGSRKHPSAELDGGVLPQFRQPMPGVDAADGAGLGAHDERFGGGAAAVVVDALEQFAVGDAGGGEEGVVAGHEDLGGQHLLEVVAL